MKLLTEAGTHHHLKTPLLILIISCLFITSGAYCQTVLPAISRETRAVIIVTGMTMEEDQEGEVRDLTVAKGATVTLTDRDGNTRVKTTEPFPPPGDRENEIYCFADFSLYSEQKEVVDRMKEGEVYYTADFGIDLDSTYSISIKFSNGTGITLEDYLIPAAWRTHFYYHWTNGQKSPASVLRIGEDAETKYRLCVYALFPLDSYKKFGGKQVDW